MRVIIDSCNKLSLNFLFLLAHWSLKKEFSFIVFGNERVKVEDVKDQLFFQDFDVGALGAYLLKVRLGKKINLEEVYAISPKLMLEEVLVKYKTDLILSFAQDKDVKEFVLAKAYLHGIKTISVEIHENDYEIRTDYSTKDVLDRDLSLEEILEISSSIMKLLKNAVRRSSTEGSSL